MTKTIGEKRVRVDFNKAEQETTRSHIDVLKEKTAELINYLDAVKNDEVSKTYDKSQEALKIESGEKLRLIALAQTAYEEAAMWAVKAGTA